MCNSRILFLKNSVDPTKEHENKRCELHRGEEKPAVQGKDLVNTRTVLLSFPSQSIPKGVELGVFIQKRFDESSLREDRTNNIPIEQSPCFRWLWNAFRLRIWVV